LSATGVVEGQRGVWQYKQLLDTHRRDYMKSVADVDRKLSVLEIEENAKKEFFKTYDTTKAQGQSLIERLYTIQLQSADKISELLSFMSEVSSPRGASFGEGELLFSQDADVDRYNGLMGEWASGRVTRFGPERGGDHCNNQASAGEALTPSAGVHSRQIADRRLAPKCEGRVTWQIANSRTAEQNVRVL
jgi:hypothetical protein